MRKLSLRKFSKIGECTREPYDRELHLTTHFTKVSNMTKIISKISIKTPPMCCDNIKNLADQQKKLGRREFNVMINNPCLLVNEQFLHVNTFE